MQLRKTKSFSASNLFPKTRSPNLMLVRQAPVHSHLSSSRIRNVQSLDDEGLNNLHTPRISIDDTDSNDSSQPPPYRWHDVKKKIIIMAICLILGPIWNITEDQTDMFSVQKVTKGWKILETCWAIIKMYFFSRDNSHSPHDVSCANSKSNLQIACNSREDGGSFSFSDLDPVQEDSED